jgi:hypothetical protein
MPLYLSISDTCWGVGLGPNFYVSLSITLFIQFTPSLYLVISIHSSMSILYFRPHMLTWSFFWSIRSHFTTKLEKDLESGFLMKLSTRSKIRNSLVINQVSGFKWIWWPLISRRRPLWPFIICLMLGSTRLSSFHGYQPVLHVIHLIGMVNL